MTHGGLATARIDDDEREQRIRLAAAYRIFAQWGWTQVIHNHITARVPDAEGHFLVNPCGLMYDEITASNLQKLDEAGECVVPSEWPVGRANFVIHSAFHMMGDDVGCVVHTHTDAGMAVSTLEEGLIHNTLYSVQYYGDISYHDFEGISVYDDERERLVASLGTNRSMIMRNHGLLTVGKTVAEAVMRMYYLVRACEVQVKSLSMGQPIIRLSEEICARTARDIAGYDMSKLAEREFAALMRMLDRADPSYRE